MSMTQHVSPLLRIMALVAAVILAMVPIGPSTTSGYDSGTGGGYDGDGYNANGGQYGDSGDGGADYGGDY